MDEATYRKRAAVICGATANGEGHHAGDPDCICDRLLKALRTQPYADDGTMVTQAVWNGAAAALAEAQARVEELETPPLMALDRLREMGWRVASHNDYAIDGEHFTFWLFTHPRGLFVKGEGPTDYAALRECEERARAYLAYQAVEVRPDWLTPEMIEEHEERCGEVLGLEEEPQDGEGR